MQENHGDIFIHEVNITNCKDEKVCEVSEEFNLSFNATKNLPLNIKIFKDRNLKQELISNDKGYYEDESFKFEAGVESQVTIYIRIEWDSAVNDYTYSQEIDSVILCANLTQLD